MKEVMRKYSTTFFECMKDWPEHIKQDIYKLYAYLRVCDEVVEGQEDYSASEKMKITKEFHEVFDRYEMEGKWLDSFHHAMLTDLRKKEHTIVSMLDYCKGSSESVGCMMARILGCPPEADYYARALGRAYQIINFVRDYEEDLEKGYEYISANHDIYIRLFKENLEEGMEGIHYIPEELRGPIFKANAAYLGVAEKNE